MLQTKTDIILLIQNVKLLNSSNTRCTFTIVLILVTYLTTTKNIRYVSEIKLTTLQIGKMCLY